MQDTDPIADATASTPLTAIAELVEQASSAVLAADADDLGDLATAHTCLQRIAAEAADLSAGPARETFSKTSADAVQIVEQIILREADDVAAALRSLVAAVSELQRLADGGPGGTADPLERRAPLATAPACAAPTGPSASTPAAQPPVVDATNEVALNADDVPLAREFISEANGHIESAEANLLKLEETPDDPEAINAIFRSFHTVKGVAGFLNLIQIGALAHAAENLLDLARKGEFQIEGESVDLILESIDLLKALLGLLDASLTKHAPMEREPRLPNLITRLHAAAHGRATRAAVPASPPPTAQPVAVTIADAPAPESASSGPAPAAVAANATTKQAPAPGSAPGDAHAAAQGDNTVKVSTERLDSLINMVGELVISQSMVSQDVASTGATASNPRVQRNLAHLNKITRELQDLSMSMRMVPIQGVFQKMARVVRDLSRKAGKEVEFIVAGGETELDRNVVEAIGDPLVHMVRNSLDHGLEPPAERLAASKSRAGRLELRARQQAGQIIIEVADDGRGLNADRILKKAIANRIVSASDTLTEQEIFQLIFAAGLSTAEKVTAISGRGVGMDVVRKNVEALRGRIDIRSTAGQGTTFTIFLPLTLAVIDGMIVRVGAERYIIPITSIQQTIRPKREQLSTVQARGELCMVRGQLMPLTRLHRLFNVVPRTQDPTESLVVIVQDNQRSCCLLVDELLGQQQVVIKSLTECVGGVRGVSGGAILGDGSISLILDVPGLIEVATTTG